MSFLCSNLTDVRKVALDVLFTVRELHGKLLQAGGRSAPVTPVTPAPSISNPPTPGKHSLQAITPSVRFGQFPLFIAAFNMVQCLVCSHNIYVSHMVDLQSIFLVFARRQWRNTLQH